MILIGFIIGFSVGFALGLVVVAIRRIEDITILWKRTFRRVQNLGNLEGGETILKVTPDSVEKIKDKEIQEQLYGK